MLWGEAGPVRFLLRPAPGSAPAPAPDRGDPDFLHREFADRLARGAVEYDLCVQRFVDERRTPVEDASVEWTDGMSPALPVARLTIPGQDLDTAEALATARRIEDLAFNPWYTTEEFRPLGNINRARKAAYQASSAHRLGLRFVTEEPLRNRVLGRPVEAAFGLLNRYVPWHRLPVQLSLLNLVFLRRVLRRLSLIDTEPREAPRAPSGCPSRSRSGCAENGPTTARTTICRTRGWVPSARPSAAISGPTTAPTSTTPRTR